MFLYANMYSFSQFVYLSTPAHHQHVQSFCNSHKPNQCFTNNVICSFLFTLLTKTFEYKKSLNFNRYFTFQILKSRRTNVSSRPRSSEVAARALVLESLQATCFQVRRVLTALVLLYSFFATFLQTGTCASLRMTRVSLRRCCNVPWSWMESTVKPYNIWSACS